MVKKNDLKTLSKENTVYNIDCMDYMRLLSDNIIDFLLTDIPYEKVNLKSNGLRNIDKGKANILTFNLLEFLKECERITKGSICIFCGKEQFSTIYSFFSGEKGTVRPVIWKKTNPSPMNGQYVYLSGVEMGVWFKKKGVKHSMHVVRILYLNILMGEANCIRQRRTTNYWKN